MPLKILFCVIIVIIISNESNTTYCLERVGTEPKL